MFPLNNWYVAAFASDVSSTPLARTICGRPVVLFRNGSGTVAALEDRCIHRGMPLSVGGECQGDIIRCPYHGLEFSSSGICTKIPGQHAIPETARLIAYKAVEKDSLVWVWVGDVTRTDAASIPSHKYHHDPQWAWTPVFLEIAADWQLLNDNLLDLTHLGFVHRNTIGGNPEAHSNAVMRTHKTDAGVRVTRWLPDSPAPPHYLQTGAVTGAIDRWQEIDFQPGVVTIWSGGTDAGTGAYEGRRDGGVQFMGFHAITPRTETTCYYHFTQARNFALGNAALEAKLHQGAVDTLLEDKLILEAQQARLNETQGRPLIDIHCDAGGLQARRQVRRQTEAEKSAQNPIATVLSSV